MIKFRAYALWLLILLAGFAILSAVAIAQETVQDQLPDPAALPFGSETAVPAPTLHTAQAIGDWSLLAYQKLQDGNWDITVHDKSGPRRLTFNKGIDQHPSLDHGAQRVAFVSDRSGDLDLYTIKVNGQGLQRILDNKSSIAFPTWSPDGARLAIQAKVAGQYEIYVVNGDGSDPQRLTYNAAFDGMPAWSPDGKQLAFASNRSGDYRIYIMNSDGSGLRRLSSYPFSLHPTWSPNGVSVAFDADVDGDGWQELAVVEAGGAHERMVYNPAGRSSTAWAGSWSPDNQALGFTEIKAELRDGNWIWVRGDVRQWNPNSGAANLIPGGKDWYMDWQSKDAVAPVTTIKPLPAFSKPEEFILRWSGIDQGGSGLKSYTVYSNVLGRSGWETFLANTSQTQTAFPAKSGTTVEFIVRAIDNAFNQGTWPAQVIEQTTFYDRMAGGKIMDNRGNPLAYVPVNASPAMLLNPVISNWQGQYTGYTVAGQGHALSTAEPNFRATPATKMAAGADFYRDIYLLPSDSRIINGTFERNGSTPVGWNSGGSLPVAISSESFATGRHALRLGQSPAIHGLDKTEDWGTASVSQTVTVPDKMQEPTLTYMVRTAGAQPAGGSGLRIFIQASAQDHPVTTNNLSAADWTLQWIDMTPWQGQQVTITFELLQDAGDPAQTVYLDDISLGSINPDLWVQLVSGPTNVVPGETVKILLDFGNRGPLLAENNVVELALPPEISLLSATPPYTIKNNVLRWEIGDLPAHGAARRLTIKATPSSSILPEVAVRSLIHSSTKEAHLRDNTAETTFQITKRVYLPFLR